MLPSSWHWRSLVHGPPLLQDPTMSFAMIGIGFFFLALSIVRKKQNKPEEPYNVQPEIAGHRILDTGDRWVLFTLFIGLCAFAAHFLAEYAFDIYDITPIDKFTHGLSGMAITAFILNFNLTRGRKVYYPTAIGVSWLAFAAWEAYEWIYSHTDPNSGIETSLWDMGIDLWIDSLGALSICFIYDEFMVRDHDVTKQKKSSDASRDTVA